MATLRHYSSLRFAILTLFSGVMAALMAAAFGDAIRQAPSEFRYACRLIGLAVALIFLGVELSIARYIRVVFEHGRANSDSYLNKLASSAWLARWVLRHAYWVLCAGVAGLWGWSLFLPL